jgi:hypothetical protein
VAHPKAKLTVFGRQLLIQRITELGGRSPSHPLRPYRLGPALGHPRSTVFGMLRRHGLSRLADTDRPACPCATAASDPASWPTRGGHRGPCVLTEVVVDPPSGG